MKHVSQAIFTIVNNDGGLTDRYSRLSEEVNDCYNVCKFRIFILITQIFT